MEQGIKTDHDLVVKRSSKSRVFVANFEVECITMIPCARIA
jgi:hypothetical protein